MANCENCGAEFAPQAAVCSHCGTKLPNAERLGAQTMLGGVSPFAQNAKPPVPTLPTTDHVASTGESPPTNPTAPKTSPAMMGTMIGFPSPIAIELLPNVEHEATPTLVSQPVDPRRALSGTMVGMPSPNLAPSVDVKRAFSGTMVGMPSPVPQLSLAAQGIDALRETQAQGTQMGRSLNEFTTTDRRFQGTLMGIAQPGIAPTHAEYPPPPAAFQPDPPPSASVSDTDALSRPPLPITSRPVWHSALFIGLGLVAAAGFGALFAKLSEPDLHVLVTRFAVDDSGQDQLELSCDQCQDGTTLRVGTASTKFEKGVARLLVEKPLALGQNQFELSVLAPDGEQLSAAPLIVPVAFRMSSNWDGRHATPPFGQITVEAPAGSTIKIDGKIAQVKGGKAEYQIPIAEKTLGEAREVERVVFDIPIEVISDSKTRSTRASLRGGITPLQLTSIGPVHELGGKPISITGVSIAGATIKFGDAQTTTNDKGEFSLNIPDPREMAGFVFAQTDELLARRVALRLTNSAETPEQEVTHFAHIKTPTFARLTGNVIESRVVSGVTRTLLELQQDCPTPPCLLATTFAEARHLVPNRTVTASGWAVPGDPISMKVTKFN